MWINALLYFASRFAVRQLAIFGRQIDWAGVKSDWDQRVKDLIPGEYFDEQAVDLTNAFFDGVASALKASDDMQKVFDMSMAKDWDGAAGQLIHLAQKTIGGKLAAALLAA